MPDSDDKKHAGTHEEEHVRRRAYDLWEREGRPHGRHEHHWHKAKEDVSRESRGNETQAVPATRVSPSAETGSTKPQEATTRSPSPAERSSGTQADPLGLVQGESAGAGSGMSDDMVGNTTAPAPQAKTRSRTAKPRGSRAKKPAGNSGAPDRPDRPRH